MDPILSGHPVLCGHLPHYQTFLPVFTVKLTCIQRTPLSGCGHRNGADLSPKTCIEPRGGLEYKKGRGALRLA